MKPLEPFMIDLIIKHLDKRLTTDESIIFNQLMHENSLFQTEVVAYANAVRAVQFDRYSALKNILKTEEKRISGLKPVYNYKRWAIAASLLIISASVLFLLFPLKLKSDKAEQLALFNDTRYTARWLSIDKGSTNVVDEQYYINLFGEKDFHQLREAWGYYLSDNYKKAIEVLEKYNIQNDTFLMARGNAFLMTDKPEKAIIDFKNVIENASNTSKDQAEWYLIEAYIKNNQMEEAKKLATDISQTNKHAFNKKATELLEKM